MTDTPKPPLARITGQQPSVGTNPTGTAVPGYRVTFETASGLTSWVFVPREGYSPQSVQDAVKAEATTLETLHGSEVR